MTNTYLATIYHSQHLCPASWINWQRYVRNYSRVLPKYNDENTLFQTILLLINKI